MGGARVSGGDESRDERRDWSLGFPTVDHRVRGGPGRIFQGCNVRSAPALIHNGTSVSSCRFCRCGIAEMLSSESISGESSRQCGSVSANVSRRTSSSSGLAGEMGGSFSWRHDNCAMGGRAGVMENIPSRTWRTYFPSLASSHERGSRMDCSFSPPPFSRLCLFCSF